MHVASDTVVLRGISFDDLCKLRENWNWTLGNTVPMMTYASELLKKKKASKESSLSLPLLKLYFAAGTY